MSLDELVPDVSSLTRGLAEVGYLADPSLSTALFCAVRLPQPLLLEGEAGVGKTQAAKALAELLEEESLFGPDYLISRPLLAALEHDGPRPAVLLIDEIDRADEEFEAFLFELLAESSVTIPEIGTLHAKQAPIVILTSNRTRDLHDALKRRCLYHWIDYPPLAQAVAIVRARVPEASVDLATEIASAVARLRGPGPSSQAGDGRRRRALTWPTSRSSAATTSRCWSRRSATCCTRPECP